jgi:RHS repeat-associated protein
MAGYADVEDPVTLLNRAPDTSGGPKIADAIREAGFEVQAVNWVWEKVVGEDLVTSIIEPITGDFEKISQQAGEWRNIKDALQAIRNNLNAGLDELQPAWQGGAADQFRDLIGTDWTLGIEADAQAANLIGFALNKVADGSRMACDKALQLIKMLVDKLIEAAAMLPIPVVGWGRAVKLVYDGIQIYNAIMQLIDGIKSIIDGAKQVIQGVQQVGTALSKIKDIHNLNDALNTANETGEGIATTASGVKGIKDGATQAASAGGDLTHAAHSAHDNATGLRDERAAARDEASASTDPASTTTTRTTENGRTTQPDGSLRNDAQNPADRAEQPLGRCGAREPVDVATGEMFMVQTDARFAGLLPLVLERTHVSSYRSGRYFGPSWSSTFDQRLEVDGQGVCYAGPDGVILVYSHPAQDGSPTLPVTGARWPLRVTDDGYTITRPENGHTLHFGPARSGVAAIAAITDRVGSRIDFEYDDGTVAAVRHSGGYHVRVDTQDGLVTGLRLKDVRGSDIDLARFEYTQRRLVGVTNSSGLPMRFEYDQDGRIVRWLARNGEWYAYHYDAAGRCVRTEGSGDALAGTLEYDVDNRMTVETDSLGNRTIHHFTPANKLARQVNALGAETSFEWSADGQLTSRVDALGRATTYIHDEHGNVASVTRPDGSRMSARHNDLRQVTELVGTDGATWHREYDERGNVLSVVNPAGARVTYAYDDRGHLSAITDESGTRRVRTDAAGLAVMVTAPNGATTRYDRDAFGRVSAVTDPNGAVTRFGWTVEGNITFRTLPDGATERWSYDAEGNRTEHVDVHGRVTRTSSTHFDLPSAVTDPTGGVHEFSYDSELRLVAVTNPQGLTWQYTYDAAGNLVSEKDFNDRVLTYSYDAAGQLASRTNGAGQTVGFEHDLMGNVVARRFDDGTVATFTYDTAGRMSRATNADADVTFERDANGSVIAETVNGRTVASTYDAMGLRRHRSTPSGLETSWDYDENHRPVAMRTAGHTISFAYDAVGREIERLVDDGTVLTQQWDLRNRLVTQSLVSRSRHAALQQRQYGYYPDGSLRSIEDQLSGARHFELDGLGRATGVTGPDWAEQYSYDQAGNVSTATWPRAHEEVRGGRNYAGTRLLTAGNTRYGHDRQGRVVVRSRKRLSAKPDVWQYEWNAEDRLVGLRTPDGGRWRYRYDALGRRISKERLSPDGSSVLERVDFTWDGSVLAEQSTSQGETTTWNYEPGGFRPVSQVDRTSDADQQWVDEQFYAIVTDLVGTPAELIDAAGNVAWHHTATLWGASSGGPTPLRFPGQYLDEESGLHYNYQRYYDPESGRYLSTDPLGLAPGPNPESYVPNPTGQIDPLGLAGCDPSLFRGTSEGYAGSPNMQRVGVTPTSTDPAVATVFATQSEQYGNGVVHIARPEDVAGVHRYPPSLGGLESEVPLDMSPTEFADRASHTIPVSQARQILDDMGISVPQQVTNNQALDAWLHQRTPMTDAQIGEFIRRATGG